MMVLVYNDPRDVSSAPSTVSTNCSWIAPRTGIIFTDQEVYNSDDTATVYLYDLDLNEGSEKVDSVNITLYSSRDLLGFELILTESGPNTAEFMGTFKFSEIGSDPAAATIHTWNNGKIYLSYNDENNNEGFSDTVTVHVTFSKPNYYFTVLLDYLPETPQNGDKVRFYARLPNSRAVSSVLIRNQLTKEEVELELIDISVYEQIYGGWVAISSPTLETTLDAMILFTDGTNLTSSPVIVTSTLGDLFTEWIPLKTLMTAEIKITTVNKRREVVDGINYNITGTSLTTGENITLLTVYSPNGTIIYDTVNETRLYPGKWLYTITSSKPGYANGTSQFILSVASGYDCPPGQNYFNFNGFKIYLRVARECILALTPSVPTTNVMNVVPSGYSPLIRSFFALDVIETLPLYRLRRWSRYPITSFRFDFPIDDPRIKNTEVMFAINMHVPIYDGTWSRQSGYPYNQWYSRSPNRFESSYYRGIVHIGYIVSYSSLLKPKLIYNYIEMGLLAPSNLVSGQNNVLLNQVKDLQEINLYRADYQLPVNSYHEESQFNTGNAEVEGNRGLSYQVMPFMGLCFVTIVVSTLYFSYRGKKRARTH